MCCRPGCGYLGRCFTTTGCFLQSGGAAPIINLEVMWISLRASGYAQLAATPQPLGSHGGPNKEPRRKTLQTTGWSGGIWSALSYLRQHSNQDIKTRQQRREVCALLTQSSEHVSLGVRQRFALLQGDHFGQFFLKYYKRKAFFLAYF